MTRAEITFQEVLQCAPGEEREAFIEKACAGDGALLEEVSGLLRAREKARGCDKQDLSARRATLIRAARLDTPASL